VPILAAGGAAGLALAAERLRRPRPVLEPATGGIRARRVRPAAEEPLPETKRAA
jgi:hypothetical protein